MSDGNLYSQRLVMKIYSLLVVAILSILPIRLFPVTQEIINKYPYQLLTNDYGILKESDFKQQIEGIVVHPYTLKINGFYWQCFHTKDVTVLLKKGIYDSYEKMTPVYTMIHIKDNSTKAHEYEARRYLSLEYAKKRINKWKAIMDKQKYVCIGGRFAGIHEKIINGEKIAEYGWLLDILKTRKGCEYYFVEKCN